ncbi:DoxX-like family protein [Maribacter sp. 2308TA10-17]|uniref:DoxX-like family protein n=1 Tax=Maribacter sp. 2308TA10-17 TaxID=3386276 RepID=UPI0039BCA2F8
MNYKIITKVLSILIASVWFINGLYCKILNFVPRHQDIVARILGEDYAEAITKTIGVLELIMVVWILIDYKSKLNAIAQITIIILMNIIEFVLAKDLLLFGYVNIVIALLFSAIIYFNEFHLKEKIVQS